MRIGMGYDVHRLTEGRDLILGGVKIPYEKGLLGHSDADVLLHAVMDALLGAAALGDIGKHFPDSDPAYKGISSLKLLEHVGELLEKEGYTVGNIDATIIAQRPKMAPHISVMRKNIAEVLRIEESQINIKATTEEGLGFTGSGEGISSQAVCLLFPAEYVYDDVMEPQQGCGGCAGCPGSSGNQ
ncbi:2-C-methyl-D-erythritol 2,4-cyclodiphosphate synthase [Lachnoclostridium sp. An131]|uniref:2-C-methyl-D-erythritol 2,4-cyclodiphosphate synthase n=1 Tax=Lachnoclostridium sp. An131 TaxID=1965555 RepID=UPI000B399648|nr:2-C-methyl-D-erythritol 2,4-cyclodiphosphate synthase [Lachnoclostridium sp. An131]OUQ27750.1 2-C-methyl-D-erythritol 2,4-cyclodiphosphate synthase [Lachnoclostridium sp. An131]